MLFSILRIIRKLRATFILVFGILCDDRICNLS
ncbi:hypothetical protein ACVLD2_004774 [Paenibacillus sp. PvR052]